MARSHFQKLKLLMLYRILYSHSDEQHPLTMSQIIAHLNQHGISAERKSIYDDIEALRLYGADIISNRGKYYIGSRLFELPELKLLIDAVQSSKMLSTRKLESLCKKLQSFCSVYEAKQLQPNAHMEHRDHTLHEETYYTIDAIHTALHEQRQMSFQYYEWYLSPTGPCTIRRRLQHDGKVYRVSPVGLIWDRDHYDLCAYEEVDDVRSSLCKRFRIDRMTRTNVLDTYASCAENTRSFDLSEDVQAVFRAFGGNREQVTIQMPNYLVGAAVDQFGESLKPVRVDASHFRITVSVQVDPQFYGWIFGLEDDVRVLAPDHVKEQIAQRVKRFL